MMDKDAKHGRFALTEEWIDLNTWHSLSRRSFALLDQAEYFRRRRRHDEAKRIWEKLGPLNIYLRSVKVRGVDFDNGKQSK
jgi:hypothetical protein